MNWLVFDCIKCVNFITIIIIDIVIVVEGVKVYAADAMIARV